ncbi:MAG TPA: TonB family protein [Burkholderiales bacterium]|nr:TonB family protein [Burkholderiales bacterium]
MKRFLMPFFLAGCAATPAPVEDTPPSSPVPPVATAPQPRVPAPARAASADVYKRDFAVKVATANQERIADSLPEMLKSVVVLNVSVDSRGNLTHVSVRRSNGFRDLENRAMDSVRRAAPFAAPGQTVTFLETFLFRDDGRFQIRSLVN